MIRIAFLVVTMCAVLSFVTACAKGGGEGAGGANTDQRKAQPDSKSDSTQGGIVAAIREKKLAEFATSTIGEAFDAYQYFDKREWKEISTPNGKIYVDFWGWFKPSSIDATSLKNGVVTRGVTVKFVINPDGSFYVAMISKIEAGADGKEYASPLADKQHVLKAIYGNKEIIF